MVYDYVFVLNTIVCMYESISEIVSFKLYFLFEMSAKITYTEDHFVK